MNDFERKAWRVTVLIAVLVIVLVACAFIAPELFPEWARPV
jgi:hypothetical protein